MKKVFTVPRIIGAVLLLIAALSYFAESGFIALLFAGVILLLAPKKLAVERFNEFLDTFSKGKIIITTALYDSLFWMLFFGSGAFYVWRLKSRTEVIQMTTTMTKEAMLNPDLAAQNASALQGLVWFFIGGLALFFVFNVVSYTLFRSLTWTTIANVKFNNKFFKSFLKLNVVWWLLWLVPVLAMAMAASKDPSTRSALAFVLILPAYFTPIVHSLFMKRQKVSYALGHGIAYAITKAHLLLVPLTFAGVLYVILYQLFRLFQFWPSRTVQAISLLFVILYLAWLRSFLYPIIAGFKEE